MGVFLFSWRRLVLKMATATPGKRAYKQDLPPKGGYAPFEYKRVPIRKFMSPARLFIGFGLTTTFGWYMLRHSHRTRNAIKVEERSTDLALQPMLEAERDRTLIREMVKHIEWEEE